MDGINHEINDEQNSNKIKFFLFLTSTYTHTVHIYDDNICVTVSDDSFSEHILILYATDSEVFYKQFS